MMMIRGRIVLSEEPSGSVLIGSSTSSSSSSSSCTTNDLDCRRLPALGFSSLCSAPTSRGLTGSGRLDFCFVYWVQSWSLEVLAWQCGWSGVSSAGVKSRHLFLNLHLWRCNTLARKQNHNDTNCGVQMTVHRPLWSWTDAVAEQWLLTSTHLYFQKGFLHRSRCCHGLSWSCLNDGVNPGRHTGKLTGCLVGCLVGCGCFWPMLVSCHVSAQWLVKE